MFLKDLAVHTNVPGGRGIVGYFFEDDGVLGTGGGGGTRTFMIRYIFRTSTRGSYRYNGQAHSEHMG